MEKAEFAKKFNLRVKEALDDMFKNSTPAEREVVGPEGLTSTAFDAVLLEEIYNLTERVRKLEAENSGELRQ